MKERLSAIDNFLSHGQTDIVTPLVPYLIYDDISFLNLIIQSLDNVVLVTFFLAKSGNNTFEISNLFLKNNTFLLFSFFISCSFGPLLFQTSKFILLFRKF